MQLARQHQEGLAVNEELNRPAAFLEVRRPET